jgi:hypothetical protein
MTTKRPFKEAVDLVCAVLQCDQKDVAKRWGKTPQHMSGLITKEKNGNAVSGRTLRNFTNEFAVELAGVKKGRTDTDKIISILVERMIRAEGYIKVIVEEMVYMKIKQKGVSGDDVTAFSKEELDSLAKRAREEAVQILREWKV